MIFEVPTLLKPEQSFTMYSLSYNNLKANSSALSCFVFQAQQSDLLYMKVVGGFEEGTPKAYKPLRK